jgi:diguanylate cyclase (GGDEF)-like protein
MQHKHKLLLVGGFLLLLSIVVASTLYGAERVRLVADNYQRIISEHHVQAGLANKMREAARERLITLWKMSLTEDAIDREALYQDFFTLGSAFLGYREQLLRTQLDAAEKDFIQNLARAAAKAAPLHRSAATQMLAHGRVITPQELLQVAIPAQQDTLTILNDIVRYENTQTDGLLAKSAAEVRETTLRMFYFLAAVLLLGGLLAILELRRMRLTLDKLSQTSQALSVLNQELELKVQERTRELYETNIKLQHLASYDPLTELPNRSLLMEQLRVIQRRAKREGERFAMLFIDVDDFKQVNDTHGHRAGDQVLKASARRFKEQVRGCDLVARLGGDEFVVALVDIHSAADVERIAANIAAAAGKPIHLGLHGEAALSLQVSIGICLYPQDAVAIEDLLHCADTRMYAQKKSKHEAELCAETGA